VSPCFPRSASHRLDVIGAVENIDLVDDDNDFLAPAADLFEECALGFREGSIR
jgi:hypothetical protein